MEKEQILTIEKLEQMPFFLFVKQWANKTFTLFQFDAVNLSRATHI